MLSLSGHLSYSVRFSFKFSFQTLPHVGERPFISLDKARFETVCFFKKQIITTLETHGMALITSYLGRKVSLLARRKCTSGFT